VNIFVQVGLVVLVALACKNAILIVESARDRQQEGASRFDAAVDAARVRLRPIVMTSFAFILGVLPLVIAQGAGAEMRRTLGTAVFAGMIGVTLFGIFLTPVFYSVVRRLSDRGRSSPRSRTGPTPRQPGRSGMPPPVRREAIPMRKYTTTHEHHQGQGETDDHTQHPARHEQRLSAADAVRSYKRLALVEQAFRTLKGLDLLVRPIHHRVPPRVQAHILLCMLAYYVEWEMRRAWAPLLFEDEDVAETRPSRDPVLPAEPSESAQQKKQTKQTRAGEEVHRLRTLLAALATQTRVRYEVRANGARMPFLQVTAPTPLQQRAFSLLGW